ncbi:hypothetical protein F4820DRAFT_405454 [Hypoxylon rubiginosum]|uniref:Uncharacterized protein n=1 Tax=Hypoxylon rubiginosum TaxID=110542 RepID=A0ACB9ZEB1_9PEZI|nr:hypothetical protein F4820DRAFT_405454 [Hypoxylon rubiginosum]
MKSFGAIVFLLATAGSLVSSTPAFRGERRALLVEPVNLAARALELVPHFRAEKRHANANETGNAARSLGPRAANSTDAEARSLVVRQITNSSEAENEKRASVPRLRRGHWEARSHNETDA